MSSPYVAAIAMSGQYECAELYFRVVQKYWEEQENRKHKLQLNEIEEINDFMSSMNRMFNEADVDRNLFIMRFFYLMGLIERVNIKMST
jgi:hypothetical protein